MRRGRTRRRAGLKTTLGRVLGPGRQHGLTETLIKCSWLRKPRVMENASLNAKKTVLDVVYNIGLSAASNPVVGKTSVIAM